MKKYELEATDTNIRNTLIDDRIGNQEYLSSIIRLLSSIDDNEVICIDGNWGVGKTFLVKQLIYLIVHCNEDNNEQFKIVESEKDILTKLFQNNLVFYYNAWENDDHSNVLESLIYNLLNDYPKYKNEITNNLNKEEALKEILNIVTKIVSSKLFNVDLSSDKIDKIKTFKDISDEINTTEEKKELFKKLLDKILDNKRMILVIDELDRCNPNYATKILEVIKHFYNLTNITVIVVSNNNELQNTIKQQYGQNFNAYNYLNRFFDYTFTIDNNRSIDYSKIFLKFKNETYLPHEVSYAMMEKYRFTLRDCNRYRLLYDTSIEYIEDKSRRNFFLNEKENYCLYMIILPIIYAFKIKDLEAYNQCLVGKTEKLEEALEFVSEYFKIKNHGKWLYDFVDIKNKNEEINDNDVIKEITNTFIRVFNSGGLDKLFLKAIKINI